MKKIYLLIIIAMIISIVVYPKTRIVSYKACNNRPDYCMPQVPKCLGLIKEAQPQPPDVLKYTCYGFFY